MGKDYYWVFLPLNPVNEGLQATDYVHIGFAAGISEGELLLFSGFGDMRELLLYLCIRHLFTNSRIQFIENSQLNWFNIVEFQMLSSFECSPKSTNENDCFIPIFKNIFMLENVWEGLCILKTIVG